MINTKYFEPGETENRIAVRWRNPGKILRTVKSRLNSLYPAIRMKLEALDLSSKLERSRLNAQAEIRQQSRLAKLSQRRAMREAQDTIHVFSRQSHDLKTPLSMLTIPLETLVVREDELPSRMRLKLEQIKISIYSLLRGVTETLDAAQVLGRKRKSILSPHNLSDFVQSIADVYQIIFESYGSVLKTRILPGIVAEIDPVQMEKILGNLLSNAIKHSLPGSETVLSLSLKSRTIELSVADGGLGISYGEKSLSQRQARTGSSWAFSSHGFGLKIVRELVRNNHGTFTLTSRKGLGSTATISLPLAENFSQYATNFRPYSFDRTIREVELLAAERTALSRRPKA